MKTIILWAALGFFGLFNDAFSQHPFFDLIGRTRIGTDFNGSCYDGKNILVYGDGGVILRSTDGAATWQRTNLDDTLNIVGMTRNGDNLVGLCSKQYAITSSDGGGTWQMQRLGANLRFYQLLARGEMLFALSSAGVMVLDRNLTTLRMFAFAPATDSYSMAAANDVLAVSAGNGSLLLINTVTGVLDSAALRSIVPDFASYALLQPITSDGASKVYLVYDAKLYVFDVAAKTGMYAGKLYNRGASTHHNSSIYHISNDPNFNDIDSVYFQMYLPSDGTIRHLKTSGNDRYISDLSFRHVQFLTPDTVVAVGGRNLIYLSPDGGKFWKTISYDGSVLYSVFNDRQMRSMGFQSGRMYHTDNAGATWLPQKNFQPKYANSIFYFPTTIFKDARNGFIYAPPYHDRDTNVILTTDGGETTRMKYFDAPSGNSQWSTFAATYDNDYLLFSRGCLQQNLGCWTVVFRLDDTLGVLHKTPLPDWQIFYVTNIAGKLYGLGSDVGEGDDKYWVFASADGGATWEKDFPFRIALENRFEKEGREISRIGNALFLKWNSQVKQPGDTFVLQNYYKIDLPAKSATKVLAARVGGGRQIFTLNGRYFVGLYSFTKSGQILEDMLYADDIASDPILWRSVEPKRYSVPNVKAFVHDSLFIFTVVDSAAGGGYGTYIGRVKKTTSVVEEPRVNAMQPLYISPPSPLPAQGLSRMNVYWEQNLDIERADFTAYNILGIPVAGKADFQVRKQNAWSGEVVWDASQLSSGVYFVRFRIGDKTASVPVVVE